jgi:flagellar assembly protein FliH
MPLIKSANVPGSVAPFSLVNIEAHAAAILARARQQAEQLLAEAQTEAETLKRDGQARGLAEAKRHGLAQGLEEGRKKGHDEALAEHREKLTQTVSSLTQSAAAFEASRDQLQAEGLRAVIELAAAIARRVARRQAQIDPQVLMANLQGAMKLVCHWADVRIALPPAQLQTLRDELPRLQAAWPQLKHVELIADESLSPGGCRVFSGAGIVDGDLDAQLDRVIEQVLPCSS